MADVKIRPRRGTVSEWRNMNLVLLEGEIGIEYPDAGIKTGDIRIKFGDGETAWNDLPYAINANEASSIYGGNITSNHVIGLKHATTDIWVASDPILEAGEIVYDDSKQSLKVGDGIHRFTELRYIGEEWDISAVYDFGDLDNPIVFN